MIKQCALTIKDFTQAYGVGRSFTYSEMAAGRLPFRKAGRRTLILRSDAEQWAASLPVGKSDNGNA